MMITRPSVLQHNTLPDHMTRGLIPVDLIDRYRYVSGASGARYLFTAIDRDEVQSYPPAVILQVADVGNGKRLSWIGTSEDQAQMFQGYAISPRGHVARNTQGPISSTESPLYVHLLAATDEDRTAVIADILAVVS